ncbi:MAG: translesion DNA synthesis-associated protein ImuA [Azoarcus sp.]|jgi:cell division inhibitor SulA/protein ImuA|nr:translesion DNA synthesis-associated protein ImuA [Azoarcus sp.]MDD2875059.1 translesion DNA synthesis-associated protein ImuA [Azoarcus sp.]MDX9837445.1 translesion DNA synthesis-associated protein ImuA [Azoarcus sp.]
MPTHTALATLPAGLVWQGRQLAHQNGPVLPTGHAALDAELPGGGWPGAAMTELLADQTGVGELSLLMPLLRRSGPTRWQVWIAPPQIPYAPALHAAGVNLGSLLLLTPATPAEAVWATRQALDSASCHAVLAWLPQIDSAGLRRLQLAAEQGSTPLFLFRTLATARQPSPAPLRLALSARQGALRIDLLKRKGPLAHAPIVLPLCGDRP